jgi:hypothetical protein
MNAKQLFKQIVGSDLEFELLPEKVSGWPTITIDDGIEDIDTENFEVLNITDDKIDVSCGGDWQEPVTFSIIKHDILDELMVVSLVRGIFQSGLTHKQILKELS